MNRSMRVAVLLPVLLGWTGTAAAQRTTEQYIPIGQSPGISGVRSYVGAITAVDPQRRTFTVQDTTGPRTIKVVEGTRIWRDRSAERLSNEAGDLSDLRVGRRVEVKYVDDQARDTADWIKVAVTAGG
jgi:hypothetical protein